MSSTGTWSTLLSWWLNWETYISKATFASGKRKNVFDFRQKHLFVAEQQNLFPQHMLPTRLNWETFTSATMFPKQCFLVQQGLRTSGSNSPCDNALRRRRCKRNGKNRPSLHSIIKGNRKRRRIDRFFQHFFSQCFGRLLSCFVAFSARAHPSHVSILCLLRLNAQLLT